MKSTRVPNGQRPIHEISPSDTCMGVVGLGLMGASIVTCLLAAGHPVAGVDHDAKKRSMVKRRVLAYLKQMRAEGLLKRDARGAIDRFTISREYAVLAKCRIIIESVVENPETKRRVIRDVERIVSPQAAIGSNTSGIPVSLLQRGAQHPNRILGIHWAEPAHVTRFMEIICGKQTGVNYAQHVMALAKRWGKEPSLLRRDIRGFITNRCMYALLREAFHLVESGYASIADVDRSIRNDLGYWITFAGPFRFMDLTGIPAYRAVMKDLLPDLSCSKKVPRLVEQLVRSGGRGTANTQGFYRYTARTARRWESAFMKFSYEIRALAGRYPEDLGGLG